MTAPKPVAIAPSKSGTAPSGNTEVRSPFTGAVATHSVGSRDGKPIYRCPDTGALFFDRATLDPENYKDYYPYLRNFDARRFDWELGIRRRRYRRQLRQMERYSTGKILLDVGAGPGYLCRVAEEEGWQATGVEISEEAAGYASRVFGVTCRPIEEIPDGSVDAITCHHVLEHIGEPVAFLRTLRQKLRPNGLLVLHVPHEQPLSFMIRDRIRRSRGSTRDMYCTLYGNIHLSGFTPASLPKVVQRAGFETYFVRTAGMWSMYYDPVFTMNYVRARAWKTLVKKVVRGAVDRAGDVIGAGDWVIGYFRPA